MELIFFFLAATGLIYNRYFNVIKALKHNCVHVACTNALKIAFILKPISVEMVLDDHDDVANADIRNESRTEMGTQKRHISPANEELNREIVQQTN